MKIRTSFVSNSSSSSFIISYNKNASFTLNDEEIKVKDFIDLFSNFHYWEDGTTVLTEEKEMIIDWLKESLEYDKNYMSKEEMKRKSKALQSIQDSEEDISFARINISYHDKLITKLFNIFLKQNLIKIHYTND